MATIRTHGARAKETVKYFVGGTYRLMNDRPVFLWAQAIAFKVLVTFVPIVILATGVLGQFLRGDQAFNDVAGYIRDFVPYQNDRLIGLLRQLQNASTAFTLVGLFGLLFSVMTMFTTLRIVVSSIFQEEWHTLRTLFGGYAFDIRMGFQVGLLFLLSLGLTGGMQALNAAGVEFLEELRFDYAWVVESWRWIFSTVGLLLPFMVSVAMFFQLFFFIPRPHPPKRSAFLGAVVTALLWDAAKYTFTFYASQIGRFDRYQVDPSPDSGDMGVWVSAFGLIIAFVLWVYYSGVVLCIGGIVSLLHERHHRAWRKQQQVEKMHHAAEGKERPPLQKRDLSPPGDVQVRQKQKAREDISVG
jgi:membrane protein